MENYTTIDHTADIGIKVTGKDLKSLFKNSALAMFDQLAAVSTKIPKKIRKRVIKVELKFATVEELLVRWLSELLSLSDVEEVVFTEVDVAELAVNQIKSIVVGVPRKYFTFKTEIKAVTYHDLKITHDRDGYTAQIIFDV